MFGGECPSFLGSLYTFPLYTQSPSVRGALLIKCSAALGSGVSWFVFVGEGFGALTLFGLLKGELQIFEVFWCFLKIF